MTKRDFFRLIIKIFGLYFVISTFFSIIPFIIEFLTTQTYSDVSNDYANNIWTVFNLAWIIVLFVFLIYKPDVMIKWLKLDKGFDDDRMDFQNFNTVNILKLAVIVIGGLLLIHNIPLFLSKVWITFKLSVESNIENGTANQYRGVMDYINLGTSFMNIVTGYLLVTNYTFFSKLLKEKKREEE